MDNENGGAADNTTPEPFTLSPRLAVSLDLFGQIVAHRAGCVTAPRWLTVPKLPKALAKLERRKVLNRERTRKNHAGLEIDSWRLARDWRRFTNGIHEFPTATALSPWVVKLLSDLELPATGFGISGRPGDLKTVQMAYLSITQLLLGQQGGRAARPDIQSLVVWLYAVPHYADIETTIATWCHYRFGGLRDEAQDKVVAAMEAEHRRWAITAAARLR